MKPKEFAEKVGVTTTTLRNWDKTKKLIAKRTLTNQRYYTEDDLDKVLNLPKKSSNNRKNYIYARVSSIEQKDDLKDQVDFLKQFVNARGIIVEDPMTDIGSGLNYKRKNWNALLDLVMDNQVGNIYISYEDRFTRFGFDWFQSLCEKHHSKIIVVNNKTTSPEEEVVNDLISIIHVFSYRVYGLRKYKNKIGQDKDVKSTKD